KETPAPGPAEPLSPTIWTARPRTTLSSLIFLNFLLCFRGFQAAQGFRIRSYTFEQRLGNRLAAGGSLDKFFFLRVADETNFGKYRWHVGADQDHERRLLYTAIHSGSFSSGHCMLDLLSQFSRFIHLVAQHDLFHQILQFVDRSFRRRVFTRSGFESLPRGREVQEICFHTAHR